MANHVNGVWSFMLMLLGLAVLYLTVVLVSFILPSPRILNGDGEIVQDRLWLWSLYAFLAILAGLLVWAMLGWAAADKNKVVYRRRRNSVVA